MEKVPENSVYNSYIGGCEENSNREKLSYIEFPASSDPDRLKDWMNFADVSSCVDISPVHSCNNHFTETNLNETEDGYLLVEDAVPTKLSSTNGMEIAPYEESSKRPHSWCILCRGNVPSEPVSYFRFPKDIRWKQKWAEFCEISLDYIDEFSCLCQYHFKEDDFITKQSNQKDWKLMLKPNVCPSILTEIREIEIPTSPSVIRVSCVLCGCNGNNPSYHNFPDDPKLRKEWLRFCNLGDVDVSKLMLCGLHFKENDFDVEGMERFLKPGVSPSINFESFRDTYVNLDVKSVRQGNEEIVTPVAFQRLYYPPVKKTVLLDSDNLTSNEMTIDSSESPTFESEENPQSDYRTPSERKFQYFDDFRTADDITPETATEFIRLAKETIGSKRRKLRSIKNKNLRLLKKVSNLENLILGMNKSPFVEEGIEVVELDSD